MGAKGDSTAESAAVLFGHEKRWILRLRFWKVPSEKIEIQHYEFKARKTVLQRNTGKIFRSYDGEKSLSLKIVGSHGESCFFLRKKVLSARRES